MIEEVEKILRHLTCSILERARDDSRLKELPQLMYDHAEQICQLFETKGDGIKNMDEFYQKYLLEYSGKYPINIRLSKEEGDLILRYRGGYRERKSEA